MIYGSSPLLGVGLSGTTGPIGPTGPTGPFGRFGPTGAGSTGSTGASIIGMTLNSSGLIATSFDDGTVETAVNVLRGETGNYYIPADADVLSTAFNIVHGVSYFDDSGPTVKNIIHLRGFTTASPDVISLTVDLSNNINIDYSLFNLSYIGVSGGSTGQLLYNRPGDKQYGLTGSLYNETSNTFRFQVANYGEKIVIVDPVYVSTATAVGFYYWNIDWELGNVFKLNAWANDPGALAVDVLAQMLNIRSPSNELVSKGLTIIVPNGVTSSNEFTTLYATTDDLTQTPDINNFEEGVSWPITIPPCFTDYADIINLVSVGDVWYGSFSHLGFTFGVAGDVVGDVSKVPSLIQIEDVKFDCARGNNIYGVCCPNVCGVTGYETIEVLCEGIFYPGLTVGGVCDSLCDRLGVCCIQITETDILRVPDFVAQCECAQLASERNALQHIWTPKSPEVNSVLSVNCENAFSRIGPCCDGFGNCTPDISEEECHARNGYYQGNGLECNTVDGIPRCSGGTGGCCDSAIETCADGVNASECLSQGRLYYGYGIPCSSYDCVRNCYTPISGLGLLTPGTEIEEGIVVGIFNPANALCLGNTAFGGLPTSIINEGNLFGSTAAFNLLTNGEESVAARYNSKYNRIGYGFDRNESHICQEDSWLLIVSKYPVMLEENIEEPVTNNILSTTSVKTFTWSHGGTYFGNIMTDQGLLPLNTETPAAGDGIFPGDATPDEGWFAKGADGAEGLTYYGNVYTFQNCANQFNLNPVWRAGHGPFYARTTMNGKWNTNWGLYNTIRMTCAERHAYNLDTGFDPVFGDRYYFGSGFTTDYDPGTWSSSQQSSVEAISAFNIQKLRGSSTFPKISNWYIPSMDELSFLAEQIANNDLNGKISLAGGIPLGDSRLGADGWIWSSTGTFNEGETAEYIQMNSVDPAPTESSPAFPVPHGTEAWSIKIDLNDLKNPKFKKANRVQNKHEVRPVRLVRCDGNYYSAESNPARYWRFWAIPSIPIDNIINGPTII